MKTERGDLNSVTRHDPEPIPPRILFPEGVFSLTFHSS